MSEINELTIKNAKDRFRISKQGSKYPLKITSASIDIHSGSTSGIGFNYILEYTDKNPIDFHTRNGQDIYVKGQFASSRVPGATLQIFDQKIEYAKHDVEILQESDIHSITMSEWMKYDQYEPIQKKSGDTWVDINIEELNDLLYFLDNMDPLDILMDNEIELDLTDLDREY